MSTVVENQSPFTDECVSFYHALPSLKQRTMLFEKIYFLIEANRRREQGKGQFDTFVDSSNWEL